MKEHENTMRARLGGSRAEWKDGKSKSGTEELEEQKKSGGTLKKKAGSGEWGVGSGEGG